MAGGALLSGFMSCPPRDNESMEHLRNWAGNLEHSTGKVHYPNR